MDGGAGHLTELEQQLLLAAAVLGLGPDTDLERANTARVVNLVLRWRGLSAEQVRSGWRDNGCGPTHGAVYAALLRMTHELHGQGLGRGPERPGPALFEGGGNWGAPGDPDQPPCWPQYNSCRRRASGWRGGCCSSIPSIAGSVVGARDSGRSPGQAG